MAKGFFDPQNTLWHWIGKVPELLCLSLLWLLLCVPIVTIVPATIALYDAIVRKLLPDEKGLYKRFFTIFRAELGRGILMSLFWLGLFALLGYGHWLLQAHADTSQAMALLALMYRITLLIPIAVFFWAVALEARFVYSFWDLHKMAVLFAVSYLPRSALVLLIAGLTFIGIWWMPPIALIAPAMMVTLQAITAEKALQAHMQKPEEHQ